ncbi:hypothetical protein D1007_35435 [Hordeum vulgare]|nr:hypothetical protein D1007_35435 [Hordeum vulgare]
MSNAPVHRSGAEIGDDALREIFASLPGLRDILSCAATCKHWRRVLADRYFLRHIGLWPDTARRPSVLAGIFSQNCTARAQFPTRNGNLYAAPQLLTFQAGRLTMHHPTFDSFVTTDNHDDDMLFDLARPLAARRGLLLARVMAACLIRDGDWYKLHLALIDKRTTHILPPPPFHMTGCRLKGCAIITAKDYTTGDGDLVDYKPPMFQVLLIYSDNTNEYVWACTYSLVSETAGGNWSAPVKCCGASELTRYGPHAGIVTQDGTAHWLFMDERSRTYTLVNISAATSQVSLTEIPIKAVNAIVPRPPIPCIVGEEGKLSFVTVGDHGVADLWIQQEKDDEGGMIWQRSELANLGSKRIGVVYFAESRGALLIQLGHVFCIVDLSCKDKTPEHFKYETIRPSMGTRCRYLIKSCSSSCCRGHKSGERCGHALPVLFEMDILGF